MNKYILTIVLPILLLPFSGCEEPDSPLLFSTENISKPENVEIRYYSVDPVHWPKGYHITANQFCSELTIKCTNADFIQFVDSNGSLSKEFESTSIKMTGKVIDSKTITFRFEEFVGVDGESNFTESQNIGVIGETKKGSETIYISVIRFHSNRPV